MDDCSAELILGMGIWAELKMNPICEMSDKLGVPFEFNPCSMKRDQLCLQHILAILIRATLPITLQVASVNDLSSDAYLAIPRSSLGTEYYVMSYIYPSETRYTQGPSQFAIIGSEDDTVVEILGDVLQNLLYIEEFETYQVHTFE